MNEKIKKLIGLYNSTRGTKDYLKYSMMMEGKVNGRWIFIGWGIPLNPDLDYKIKRVKENLYLMTGEDRYTLTDVVKEVLEIE